MKTDNDTTETGKALDTMRKQRKAEFRRLHMGTHINKIEQLAAAVEVKNNGEHLIVHRFKEGKVSKLDYWPSTQKWKNREANFFGRGIDSFLALLS